MPRVRNDYQRNLCNFQLSSILNSGTAARLVLFVYVVTNVRLKINFKRGWVGMLKERRW